AQRGAWNEGARGVFQRFGISSSHTIDAGASCQTLAANLERWLKGLPEHHTIAWVGNGGTKPQTLAIAQVLAKRQFAYLYNQDRPACLEFHPQGVTGPVAYHPYKVRITLHDILEVSGHEVFKRTEKKLWPNPPPLPSDSYGHDPHVTFDNYATWFLGQPKAPHPTKLPRYQEVAQSQRENLQQWKREVCIAACRSKKVKEITWDNLINRFIKILEQTLHSRRHPQAAEKPAMMSGERFESAVAKRFLGWLQQPSQEPFRQAISEIWMNVNIAHRKSPERIAQELDLAIVLRNGVLLAIECKVGQFDRKDLDARLLNILVSGSRLARMALAVPAYTDYRGPGLEEMINRWRRLRQFKTLHPLPFTLPGQSPTWVHPREEIKESIPSFEEELARWLGPYAIR
ncbi:MAG: hypothetical protein D6819_06185, partial [Gammaproteobacteria bacterium]